MAYLATLPDRLDDAAMARVNEIANTPLPPLRATSPEHFASCLRSLSILPRRADDDCTGEHRAKLYARMLGHLPAEAISFLARTALEHCQWFPSIAECLEIVARWQRNDDAVRARRYAAVRAASEHEARFRELKIAILKGEVTEADLAALPERTLRMLDEIGLIRMDGESATLRNIGDGDREFMLWWLERAA